MLSTSAQELLHGCASSPELPLSTSTEDSKSKTRGRIVRSHQADMEHSHACSNWLSTASITSSALR
jgi:hypothetical protein